MLSAPDPVVDAATKGLPEQLRGRPLSQIGDAGLHLSDLITPVLTLHVDALEHDERTMAAWARAQGVLLAPHGKTTMAPALWQRLLDAGAWGITVATPAQAAVAIDAGVRRVLIANPVVDAQAVHTLMSALEADEGLRVVCWADAVETVELLAEGAASRQARLDVLVEMGGAGGRTGARTVDAGRRVAAAITAAPGLRLAGVGGYEGPFGPDRSAASIAAVDAFLETIVAVHRSLAYENGVRPILTAGGSAFPDRAATVLRTERADADIVLRSGAFQIHDDGHYQRMSPFGAELATAPLRAAMHVWSRVVSRPEPGLALLDAGRRDVPFDMGMPVPQSVPGEISALNDQHAFLRIAPERALPVGAVVRLGLSHHCTAFDKWRTVVMIDDPDADDPAVIGAVATCF